MICSILFTIVNPNKRIHRSKVTDSISSPTMAGGLFTVLKKTFYHLGAYDKTGLKNRSEVGGHSNPDVYSALVD